MAGRLGTAGSTRLVPASPSTVPETISAKARAGLAVDASGAEFLCAASGSEGLVEASRDRWITKRGSCNRNRA